MRLNAVDADVRVQLLDRKSDTKGKPGVNLRIEKIRPAFEYFDSPSLPRMQAGQSGNEAGFAAAGGGGGKEQSGGSGRCLPCPLRG